MLIDPARLTAPVDDASPCGDDLEYDPDFIALLDAAETRPEQQVGGAIIPAREPDWPKVARDALALLDRSKDLRIAAILAEAMLRIEGLPAFATVLGAVREWLDIWWDGLHPRLDPEDDDDPTMRVNAMAAFAAPETMLRALRAAPLTDSRALGRFSGRDLMIAAGEMSAPADSDPPDLARIEAAFEDTDADRRAALIAALDQAIDHVAAIDRIFSDRVGMLGPDLAPLDHALRKLAQLVAAHSRLSPGEARPAADGPAAAPGGDAAAPGPAPAPAAAAAAAAPGEIRSREDVIRMLDRICDYYTQAEPSSPVPLLLRRARRLVNADFATIVRDMASDGYDQMARIAGIVEE
ncbi:MAG: hypothetical protein KatS3mg118_0565 [Paracoccaceae bacterium]|nr:MAG: hypothetical protein KatS3mg118_0565 [Paracoccaceae bacterium]